ncbi:hypothetical protein GRF29_1536g89729 [Pseudopithomyces chartarum]|uniref:Biotrophy-associated secreted protein 2 n=1 Tax=Pseudopithomyces chartarum TaxID=1892770 RepID=A0AAN6LKI5_9PLEO|nr:hypothetical protein GRF29_1536g89729 [Pseudopithomyces chartarum]
MAPLFKLVLLLNASIYVAAQGTQFITGACTSDADCASSCCGFNSGKCAAVIPAQERDGGCGFGNATPNAGPNTGAAAGSNGSAAAPDSGAAAPAAPVTTSPASTGSGKTSGTQFITGSGKCAAIIPAQERDGGCGFGDAQPNAGPGSGAATAQAQSTDGQAADAPVAAAPPASTAAPANGAGTQFITGACTTDADCSSACCGFKSGKCAGPVVAQERDGGCGFGDAQPNDNAAKALQGRSLGRFGANFM